MTAAEPASEKLRKAIEVLRRDLDRVEFWADTLDRLTQPVPEYRDQDHLSRFLLSHERRRARQH